MHDQDVDPITTAGEQGHQHRFHHMNMTKRELDCIVAALRMWAAHLPDCPSDFTAYPIEQLHEIARGGDDSDEWATPMLSYEEMVVFYDQLIEEYLQWPYDEADRADSWHSANKMRVGWDLSLTPELLEAARKEAGSRIDPATAEVMWRYAQTLDPYGDTPDLPAKLQSVGREWFARAPGSYIWVWFPDLPQRTRDALESK